MVATSTWFPLHTRMTRGDTEEVVIEASYGGGDGMGGVVESYALRTHMPMLEEFRVVACELP